MCGAQTRHHAPRQSHPAGRPRGEGGLLGPWEMADRGTLLAGFLRERKKYWLLPIIIVLALFGVLIVLSQGSAVAPFIYTIF